MIRVARTSYANHWRLSSLSISGCKNKLHKNAIMPESSQCTRRMKKMQSISFQMGNFLLTIIKIWPEINLL